MPDILNKGLARAVRIGGEDYSAYRNRKLTEIVGELMEKLGDEERRDVMTVIEVFKSEPGRPALRNFSTAIRKLFRVELRKTVKVEYVIPVKPLGRFVKLKKGNDIVRGAIPVELAVGVTDPTAETKRYSNYFIPAVIIVDYDAKNIKVKKVTIATSRPAIYRQRLEQDGPNPFLEEVALIEKPTTERVVRTFSTGQHGPDVGYPLNGSYIHASSTGFEYSFVEFAGRRQSDGYTVVAVINTSSDTGVDKKTVKLGVMKCPAVSVTRAELERITDGSVSTPFIYTLRGDGMTVSFTMTTKKELKNLVPLLAPALTGCGEVGELPLDILPRAKVSEMMRLLNGVPDGGVRIPDVEIRVNKENAKLINPFGVLGINKSVYLLPLVAKYTRTAEGTTVTVTGALVLSNGRGYVVAPTVRIPVARPGL